MTIVPHHYTLHSTVVLSTNDHDYPADCHIFISCKCSTVAIDTEQII